MRPPIRLDLGFRFPAKPDRSLPRLLWGFLPLIRAVALGAQRGLNRFLSAGFGDMAQADRHRNARLAQCHRGLRHVAQTFAPVPGPNRYGNPE